MSACEGGIEAADEDQAGAVGQLLHPEVLVGQVLRGVVDSPRRTDRLRRQDLNAAQVGGFTCDFDVVVLLEVQPVSVRLAEQLPETQRRVGGDGTLTQNDLIDAPRRYVDQISELAL